MNTDLTHSLGIPLRGVCSADLTHASAKHRTTTHDMEDGKQYKRSSNDSWVNKMHHILQRSQSHKATEDRVHLFTENVQSGGSMRQKAVARPRRPEQQGWEGALQADGCRRGQCCTPL